MERPRDGRDTAFAGSTPPATSAPGTGVLSHRRDVVATNKGYLRNPKVDKGSKLHNTFIYT